MRTMRMPWNKSKAGQLDLLDGANAEAVAGISPSAANERLPAESPAASSAPLPSAAAHADGEPLVVPVDCLDEDEGNPRTEFPESELIELAEDIGQRGILQPIVVHPADANGRYRIHFGAKRLRAARRAS